MLREGILQLGCKVAWDELPIGCGPSGCVDIWKERTDFSGRENSELKRISDFAGYWNLLGILK